MVAFCSLTFGLGMIAMHRKQMGQMYLWLGITWLLGFGFMCMEVYEFHHLIEHGNGPQRSAFLSSFFTLVGMHGLHVTAGLIWMAIMMIEVAKTGLGNRSITRLSCLSLFWHFLDIVWICVFTVVYLLGAL